MKNRLVVLLLLALLILVGWQSCTIQKQRTALETYINTNSVLNDSTHQVKTGVGVVSRKITFNSLVDAKSRVLTPNQKHLFTNIGKAGKSVVVAAQVVQVARVTNLVGSTSATQADSSLVYTMRSDTLSYHITTTRTRLTIDTLTIPNKLFLDFHKEAGKMVVDVHNSNPLLKTLDQDSYQVPTEKPHTFKKILIGIGLGLIAGFAISH